MGPRWWFGLVSSILLASVCGLAQSGGQPDPWSGASAGVSGVLGVPLNAPSADVQPGSRRADEGKVLEFKSQTTLVEVPAVVTDKSGGHIHNLTKADFRVTEDGKEQRIASFEEITPATDRLIFHASPPGTVSNLHLEGQQPHSVSVIVLDTVNTPFLDQAYARGQLIKYLADHLDSTHVLGLMVINSKGLKVLSDLTTDPAVLIATLRKVGGEVSAMESFQTDSQALAATGSPPNGLLGGISPGADPEAVFRKFILKEDAVEGTYQQARAIETTLRAFLSIAWSLSGVPGRKSVVWATGSFPFYLDTFAAVPGDNALRALYERAMKALNDANISVYPLDVRGLLSDPTYFGNNTGSMLPEDATSLLQNSTLTSLKNFARMTGGHAYYGNNDLANALKHAAEDSSSYYLLGYYLDSHNNRPGWRKLQVAVSRKDADVGARAGFLVTSASVNPEVTHKADVEFALGSPFESTGIAVTEQWLGESPDGSKKKVGFALQVPATGLINEADKNRFDVEFVARATKKGVTADTVGQTIKGMLPANALAKIKADGIFYRNTFDLAPGEYQVRFVVRDNLSGRIGSVIVPLTVN
jgi:VWFA-related protein